MSENLRSFLAGCIDGGKSTPREFFAPIIALNQWVRRTSEEALSSTPRKTRQRAASQE